LPLCDAGGTHGIDLATAISCTLKFRKNSISPPLVIVAYFAPVHRVVDIAGARDLINRFLLHTPIIERVLAFSKRQFVRADLVRDLQTFSSNQRPCDLVDAAGWETYRSSLADRMPALAHVLWCLSEMTPSEASAERLFSRLKRQVGADRKRLTPENASMVTRLCCNDNALKSLRSRDGGTIAESESPNADVALAADLKKEQFVAACKYIVRLAAEKIAEASTRRTEAAKAKESSCAKCKQSWNNHAQQVPQEERYRCVQCKLLVALACCNIEQPDRDSFTCGMCELTPHWW